MAAFISLLLSFLFMFFLSKSHIISANSPQYEACSQPQTCGERSLEIKFPFYIINQRPPYCGLDGFDLTCSTTDSGYPVFQNYTLKQVSYSDKQIVLSVVENDPNNRGSGTIVNSSASSGCRTENGFTECRSESNSSVSSRSKGNPTQGSRSFSLELTPRNWSAESADCNVCEISGGVCGSVSDGMRFTCHCQNISGITQRCDSINSSTTTTPTTTTPGHKKKTSLVIIIIATIILVVLITVILLFCYFKRLQRKNKHMKLAKESEIKVSMEKDVDTSSSLEIISRHISPRGYSYSDIEKMTNGFAEKLGAGGFGTVYKGTLFDDCDDDESNSTSSLVAVKLLNKSDDDATAGKTSFLREVLSISKTSHINVVRLVGYCSEGSVRALIYEFMPNGSLSDLIFRDRSSSVGWDQLLRIALGVAEGLDYLHRFCQSRMVHLDIKPHNILLDKDRRPKIADFGLARLCNSYSTDGEVVLSKKTGTPGYMPPELWSRANYHNAGVSHKSDVYSYGITILNMVKQKKKSSSDNNEHDEHDEEKDYCDIIVDIYQRNENTVDRVGNKVEYESVKKMIIVGLKCMQGHPKERPSMTEVINILAASTIDGMRLPPIPSLYGPPSQKLTHVDVSDDAVSSSQGNVGGA